MARPTKKPNTLQSRLQALEIKVALLGVQVSMNACGQATAAIAAMVAANAKAYEGAAAATLKGVKKGEAEGSRPIHLSDGPNGAICIQFADEAVISLSADEAKLLAARLMRMLKP